MKSWYRGGGITHLPPPSEDQGTLAANIMHLYLNPKQCAHSPQVIHIINQFELYNWNIIWIIHILYYCIINCEIDNYSNLKPLKDYLYGGLWLWSVYVHSPKPVKRTIVCLNLEIEKLCRKLILNIKNTSKFSFKWQFKWTIQHNGI